MGNMAQAEEASPCTGTCVQNATAYSDATLRAASRRPSGRIEWHGARPNGLTTPLQAAGILVADPELAAATRQSANNLVICTINFQ